LTHRAPFWVGPSLEPSQITAIGWNGVSQSELAAVGSINSMPLDDLRRLGIRQAAQQVLQAIPESASILLHFDIDVLREQDLPVAYFPHTD
jgi:hypothetical protein